MIPLLHCLDQVTSAVLVVFVLGTIIYLQGDADQLEWVELQRMKNLKLILCKVRGYIRESYSGEKKTTWAVKRVFRSHRTVGINVLYAQRVQQDRLQLNLKNFSVAGNQRKWLPFSE